MQALVPEWTALWRHVPDATPFQSPAWLLAWWRHFGTGMPHLLTARVEGVLAGVLPLYELHEPGCRKLLPLGIGLSDYIDALVDPACPTVADALLGGIADIAQWDECHLPDLPPGAALAAARCPAALRECSGASVPCPVLALPRTSDELDRVVPRKTLRDLRQAASRAAASGGIMIETADSDTLDRFIDDLIALHAARWRRRGEPGVLAGPALRTFHRDAARGLQAAGMLRLYRLRIGGTVAAVYYGFAWNRRSYAYLGGFDPGMPRLSPGAQILFHAITRAITEGCTEFHFLRGGEAYKYAWGAVDRWNTARTFRRR